VNWFKRGQAVIGPPETDHDRLELIEREYQQAKAEHIAAAERERDYVMSHRTPPELYVENGRAYTPVNANKRSDPTLAELRRAKEKARQTFVGRMRERAEWRKRCGLIR
jgi:hypothetical protein